MNFGWPHWSAGEQDRTLLLLSRRSGGTCERCGAPYDYSEFGVPFGVEVHHKRYAGELRLSDLLLLCGPCHKAIHREPRAPQRPPDIPVAELRRLHGIPGAPPGTPRVKASDRARALEAAYRRPLRDVVDEFYWNGDLGLEQIAALWHNATGQPYSAGIVGGIMRSALLGTRF